MQNSELIKKNNLLEELVSKLNKGAILETLEGDSTIHVIERNKYKRMIGGFIEKSDQYRTLSENNVDYFLEMLFPLYENNIKYIKTVEDFVEVVKGVNGTVDPLKINEHMVNAFNEEYCIFTKSYPLFKYDDPATFVVQEGSVYTQFVGMLMEVYNNNVDKKPFTFENYRTNLQEKLSNADIVDKIFNIFDKNQIQLAWAVLFGKLKQYDDDMRDEIAKYVGAHQNEPDVQHILGESFITECDSLSDDDEEGRKKFVEDAINANSGSEDIERDEEGNPINDKTDEVNEEEVNKGGLSKEEGDKNLSEGKYIVTATDPTEMYLDEPVDYPIDAKSEDDAIEKVQKENIKSNDGDTTEVDTYQWTARPSR